MSRHTRLTKEFVETVYDQSRGMRLRDFLIERFVGIHCTSAKEVRRLIDRGAVLLNGRIECLSSAILKKGDVIRLFFKVVNEETEPVQILYEDDVLCVLSKPAFCLSSIEALCKSSETILPSWHLAHRLDKETSGVLLLAKDKETLEDLKKQFHERTVQKTYLALVAGRVARMEGSCTQPLALKARRGNQAIWHVDPVRGQDAETHYRVVRAGSRATLIQLTPKTGRTHQLRIHMAHLGYPILGDKVYGHRPSQSTSSDRFNIQTDRQMLHAYELSILHPVTKKVCHFTAPIPMDMKKEIERYTPSEKEERQKCESS